MATRLPTTSRVDRVAGTELGLLWFLPALTLTLLFVVSVPGATKTAGVPWFWLSVSALSLIVFAWAWLERLRARSLLRFISQHEQTLRGGSATFGNHPLTLATELVQYRVTVSMLLLSAQFTTSPGTSGRALIPTLASALFGWWSFPYGPFTTIATIASNLRGGQRRSVLSLLEQLHAEEPPKAAWWRRMLALDSGSTFHIVLNSIVLLFFVLLAGLILTALIVDSLRASK